MDKKTILAFLLIGMILVVTQTNWYKKSVLGVKERSIPTTTKTDSTYNKDKAIEKKEITEDKKFITQVDEKKNADINKTTISNQVELKEDGVDEDIVIETDNYRAVLSTRGAIIKKWELKKYFYDKDNNQLVQMIRNEGFGNLGIQFASNNDTVYTYKYIFTPDKYSLDLTKGKISDSIVFEWNISDNKKLRKIYTFHNDNYLIDLDIEMVNLDDFISDQKYTLLWLSGLHHTEKDILEDMRNTKAYIFTGGDREELKLAEKPDQHKQSPRIDGKIDWVALRTKYFASIIFPKTDDNILAQVSGETKAIDKKNVIKNFSTRLQLKIPPTGRNDYSQNFQVYLGPLDYNIIKEYHEGFDKIMGYGPAIIRPFAKLTIWVFTFLHDFIPNYGVVLIVFSILVKLVVYPLTRKSYVSMREMQKLQPLMTELREKYGKDPQRMNKETMKLYKEHGVNPLSGCLPNLIQMPLLFAIFMVFRNTIELRQEPFVFWITDLSAPDTILLPFALPLIGNALHIIPIIMGASMFWQQKMTMKDPKQKAMVYFMPIFLTFIFYRFPSGLNLYYTLFNVLSMIQQKMIPDKHSQDDKPQISNVKKDDKSKSGPNKKKK